MRTRTWLYRCLKRARRCCGSLAWACFLAAELPPKSPFHCACQHADALDAAHTHARGGEGRVTHKVHVNVVCRAAEPPTGTELSKALYGESNRRRRWSRLPC